MGLRPGSLCCVLEHSILLSLRLLLLLRLHFILTSPLSSLRGSSPADTPHNSACQQGRRNAGDREWLYVTKPSKSRIDMVDGPLGLLQNLPSLIYSLASETWLDNANTKSTTRIIENGRTSPL